MKGSPRTLFTDLDDERRGSVAPLAVRMRPRTLDEIVGQDDAVGEGTWLARAIAADALTSVILYGPAGTGKTSIAQVIANTTNAVFVEVSAVSGTVGDLRREIAAADERLVAGGRRTILFIDEIHRFSRSQQDALLHAVEDRIVILVGATTENPFFEVNSALISRSRVVTLGTISHDDIRTIVERAIADERGLAKSVCADDDALDAIATLAGGDARAALTTLELAASLARAEAAGDGAGGSAGNVASDSPDDGTEAGGTPEANSAEAGGPPDEAPVARITLGHVRDASPTRQLAYDRSGDAHYDVISAFIKSMRGSDPDAALYWLARMYEGGEDPKFIARRMLILASEDIGLADPRALPIAEAAFKSAEVIGWPECRINLAHAAVYLALAPKSNSAYKGIDAAIAEVRDGPARAVPDHLRDRHRPDADSYGPYLYPHDYEGGYVEQRYLPDGLERGCFFTPGKNGWEAVRFPDTDGTEDTENAGDAGDATEADGNGDADGR